MSLVVPTEGKAGELFRELKRMHDVKPNAIGAAFMMRLMMAKDPQVEATKIEVEIKETCDAIIEFADSLKRLGVIPFNGASREDM